MKQITLSRALVAAAVALLSTTASATTFTFDQAGLLDMQLAFDNSGEGALTAVLPVEYGGVEFAGTISDTGDPFRSIGIGYAWPTFLSNSDLSGYDSYRLRLDNPDDTAWSVNLYMTTGWTDSPFNEDPKFYESDWTLLNPGEAVHLEIDFDTVEYLNHVTGIGLQIGVLGADMPGGMFRIRAGVPVPGVLFLCIAGVLGIAAASRLSAPRKVPSRADPGYFRRLITAAGAHPLTQFKAPTHRVGGAAYRLNLRLPRPVVASITPSH